MAGCDQVDEESVVGSVSFFEVSGIDSVMVGREAVAATPLALDQAFRDTLAFDENGYSLGVTVENELAGNPFIVLMIGERTDLRASLLFRPYGEMWIDMTGDDARIRDLASKHSERETPITVFVLPNGEQPVAGRLRLVFDNDEARAFDINLADHVVQATPAVQVRGSELAWRGDALGFAFRVGGFDSERFVPLSLYRFEFAQETDGCSSLMPRWEAATYNGIGFCTAVEPSTFEYRLFLLEKE